MDCDDSDDWVYSAEWIAADLLAMKQRRLAAEHTINRWYLVESKDFGRTQRYLLEMPPSEADLYDRDKFILVDYGEGPMGKVFAEAGIRDPLTGHGHSLKSYIYGSYSDAQPSTEWIDLLGFQREVSDNAVLCKCGRGCNRTAVSDAGFCSHCGIHELRMEWLDSLACCGCHNIGCCQVSPPSEEPCTEVDGHYWATSSSRCRRLDCRASFCVAYGCNKELMCICTPTRPLR